MTYSLKLVSFKFRKNSVTSINSPLTLLALKLIVAICRRLVWCILKPVKHACAFSNTRCSLIHCVNHHTGWSRVLATRSVSAMSCDQVVIVVTHYRRSPVVNGTQAQLVGGNRNC